MQLLHRRLDQKNPCADAHAQDDQCVRKQGSIKGEVHRSDPPCASAWAWAWTWAGTWDWARAWAGVWAAEGAGEGAAVAWAAAGNAFGAATPTTVISNCCACLLCTDPTVTLPRVTFSNSGHSRILAMNDSSSVLRVACSSGKA